MANELLESSPRLLRGRRRHLSFPSSSVELLLISLSFLDQAVHLPMSIAFSPPVDIVASQRKQRPNTISYPPVLSSSSFLLGHDKAFFLQ